MQAATLSMIHGWRWVTDGLQIFRRQPMAMFFWSLATGFLITVSALIPLIGQMALIAITPLLTFITLCACRNICAGRLMLPTMWLQPVRNRDVRRRLLGLGLAYLACCLLGGFVATLPFMDQLMAAVGTDGNLDEAALIQAVQGPFITFALLYVLISALFWHAPALMGWHGIPLTQALFYSMVACWRNKWPFLLYGATWAAIFFGVQFLATALIGMGVSPGAVQIALTPLNLLIAAVLYCSFYPVWISVFGANEPQEIEAGAPPR